MLTRFVNFTRCQAALGAARGAVDDLELSESEEYSSRIMTALLLDSSDEYM